MDDEDIFHFINSKVIELMGVDCKIQTASRGREVLEIINGYLTGSVSVPDVIFINLDMPIMDGLEFARVFQQMEFPHKKKTSIVILTSSIDDTDKERARSYGIKYFITKPLAEEDLFELLLLK